MKSGIDKPRSGQPKDQQLFAELRRRNERRARVAQLLEARNQKLDRIAQAAAERSRRHDG